MNGQRKRMTQEPCLPVVPVSARGVTPLKLAHRSICLAASRKGSSGEEARLLPPVL